MTTRADRQETNLHVQPSTAPFVPRLRRCLSGVGQYRRNHRNIDRVALGDRGRRLTSRSAFDGLLNKTPVPLGGHAQPLRT